MSKSLSKRLLKIRSKIDFNRNYHINKAIVLLKERKSLNFLESVDVAIKLGIDARKSDQNIKGTATLPYGTGRSVRVAVFTKDFNKEAKQAGADLVGAEDLANEIISTGKTNFKVVIASPEAMSIVSKLGTILGPKGLMPNLKVGTITSNIYEAVKNAKSGQIRYRNDKSGIVHSAIGKIDFENSCLINNLEFLLDSLKKIKPINLKGTYFKKIVLSTTMGIGLTIDLNSINIV